MHRLRGLRPGVPGRGNFRARRDAGALDSVHLRERAVLPEVVRNACGQHDWSGTKMPVIRGFALSLAAFAALCTLNPRAAGQLAASADPATQIQIGNEAFEAARYQEAIDAYNRAIEGNDPALATRARKGKVRTALRVAEFELAKVEAEMLTAGLNADAESHTLLGDALWGNGLFDEADATYRAALEMEPESSRARFGLARSLATTSR